MCKSKAQGGQRCVGHATQRLSKAQERKAAVEAAFAAGDATEAQVAAARSANWTALVDYASTGAGAEALREQWAAIGNRDDANAKVLQGAIDDGALLAQANRRAENTYRASLDKGPLATPVPMTVAQQDQMEAAERDRAAAEAARNADPLGLRADQTNPGLPLTAPVAPGAVKIEKPAPQTKEERAAAAQQARDERAAAAAVERAERAAAAAAERAEVQRVREERAAAVAAERAAERAARSATAQQAREERSARSEWAKLERSEARRLTEEATAEARRVKTWFTDVGSKQFSAPESTWAGPSRWSDEGVTASASHQKTTILRAQQMAPAAFEAARVRYAGEYSAYDIAEAMTALDAQACSRLTGQVRPRGWYAGYQTVGQDSVDATREDRYNAVIKDAEFERLRAGYVAANVSGLLARSRSNRPLGSRRSELVRSARVRVVKAIAKRRERRRVLAER